MASDASIVVKAITVALIASLIGLGAWLAFHGAVNCVANAYPWVALPEWLLPGVTGSGGGGSGTAEFQAMLVEAAVLELVTGCVACVAGGLLFTRKKWSMVLGVGACALLLVKTLPSLSIFSVTIPLGLLAPLAFVVVASLGIGVFGIVWLLVNRKFFSK